MSATRAEAQWVVVKIENAFKNGTIHLSHAKAIWGKFHANGNKNQEISANKINEITIPAGSFENFSAAGRASSPSGTEGIVDLNEGQTRICTLYWNCPWGSHSNGFEVRNRHKDYSISVDPWNTGSGALGHVGVEVSKKG